MRILIFLILAAPLGASTVFIDNAAGEMGPSMIIMKLDDEWPIVDYDQTIQLHEKWNLVSWHIIPIGNGIDPIPFQQILPNPSWFTQAGGELYKWNNNQIYWPMQQYENEVWNLDYAYYMKLNEACTWGYTNKPRFTPGQVAGILPSDAWAHDQNVGSPYAGYWFFLGYAAPGYCKLSSIVNSQYLPQPPSGNPQYFDYEGPFHDLIWHDANPWGLYDLKIIKDDQGKAYIPRPGQGARAVDQIGMLQPGKGYFLGFSSTGPYTFPGWQGWPQWQNDNYIPPELPGGGRGVASAGHFQYQPYTHWSYPVYIDSILLEGCIPEGGDEIGIFDGDLCVGAAAYPDSFPVLVTAWENDFTTPEVDGYGFGNPMILKWYDASANAEYEFTLPPTTQAMADDPIAPDHSGFGWGLYARRSLLEGHGSVTQLPQVYKLRQNFPNPFNVETVIPLELPQRSRVKLEIYNVKGQRLGMPFDHTYDAGWPKIRWNAAKLPSGIYFYRITAEGLERGGRFVDAGKMLVLK